MKRRRRLNLLVLFSLAVCLSLVFNALMASERAVGATTPSPTPYQWELPAWTPEPIVPKENPITVEKVVLGRHLFYEPRLSVTGEYSCATCHEQALAFTDGKKVSIGATGEPHPRNSMSLANVAYSPVLTWANPLMTSLETQLLVPMFGEHPVEMGMAGREQEMLASLRGDRAYQELFARAFPEAEDPVSIRHIAQAIASFERTLISFNSPYDRYRYGGDPQAISEAAKRGEKLFNSERLECFHCHGGVTFSDSVQHDRLAFNEIAFHNTGLYNVDGDGSYPYPNTGVHEITGDPNDMGRFRAPTLRNITLTAPYMHDGSIATLEEAIAHYAAGGRTIATGKNAGVGSENPYKSNFIVGFSLSEQERQDLLAFLQSLTDENITNNLAFSNPHDGN